jgi:hypothetical protein
VSRRPRAGTPAATSPRCHPNGRRLEREPEDRVSAGRARGARCRPTPRAKRDEAERDGQCAVRGAGAGHRDGHAEARRLGIDARREVGAPALAGGVPAEGGHRDEGQKQGLQPEPSARADGAGRVDRRCPPVRSPAGACSVPTTRAERSDARAAARSMRRGPGCRPPSRWATARAPRSSWRRSTGERPCFAPTRPPRSTLAALHAVWCSTTARP